MDKLDKVIDELKVKKKRNKNTTIIKTVTGEEKIVYIDRIIEKPVEKIVYVDKVKDEEKIVVEKDSIFGEWD